MHFAGLLIGLHDFIFCNSIKTGVRQNTYPCFNLNAIYPKSSNIIDS